MRIIAGVHRRRRLVAPVNQETRPMPDRLRETLFDILGDRVANKVFVDLYAGSGSVGLEALSRGAGKVIFVENDPKAAKVLRKNITTLGAQRSCVLLLSKTEEALPTIDGEIYFVGPPYPLLGEYEKSMAILATHSPELVVVQHSKTHNLSRCPASLARARTVTQGSNCLTFFEYFSGTTQ